MAEPATPVSVEGIIQGAINAKYTFASIPGVIEQGVKWGILAAFIATGAATTVGLIKFLLWRHPD
jgi:hypothetical protein